MTSDNGYQQAIANLAYFIIKYSERDFSEFKGDFEDNTNLMMAYLEDHPNINQEWNSLEEAADIICTTYDVEYTDLMGDVWRSMLEQDPDIPKTWN